MALSKILNASVTDSTLTTTKLATPNLGRRNIVINGAMQVAQRATSATGVGEGTVGYVALDRFRLQKSANPPARYTMTQDSNAPAGFANSMKLEVTTADTSVASGSLQYIDQFIEAQNLQQLAYGTASAKKITLSFYVKCSTAQTFALDLVNEDNSRYFNTIYTVSSADTWERKTITIPADTASGFNNDNGRGLRVRWTLLAGSDFTDGSVSTAWSGTQHTATNHQNTWVGATGRTWQLTGVQLEVADEATPFEVRSYGEELALCQRYFETGNINSVSSFITTNVVIGTLYFATTKRANPAVSYPTLFTVYVSSSTPSLSGHTTSGTPSIYGFFIRATCSSTAHQAKASILQNGTYIADSEL